MIWRNLPVIFCVCIFKKLTLCAGNSTAGRNFKQRMIAEGCDKSSQKSVLSIFRNSDCHTSLQRPKKVTHRLDDGANSSFLSQAEVCWQRVSDHRSFLRFQTHKRKRHYPVRRECHWRSNPVLQCDMCLDISEQKRLLTQYRLKPQKDNEGVFLQEWLKLAKIFDNKLKVLFSYNRSRSDVYKASNSVCSIAQTVFNADHVSGSL